VATQSATAMDGSQLTKLMRLKQASCFLPHSGFDDLKMGAKLGYGFTPLDKKTEYPLVN